jgi:hypothetical protein
MKTQKLSFSPGDTISCLPDKRRVRTSVFNLFKSSLTSRYFRDLPNPSLKLKVISCHSHRGLDYLVVNCPPGRKRWLMRANDVAGKATEVPQVKDQTPEEFIQSTCSKFMSMENRIRELEQHIKSMSDFLETGEPPYPETVQRMIEDDKKEIKKLKSITTKGFNLAEFRERVGRLPVTNVYLTKESNLVVITKVLRVDPIQVSEEEGRERMDDVGDSYEDVVDSVGRPLGRFLLVFPLAARFSPDSYRECCKAINLSFVSEDDTDTPCTSRGGMCLGNLEGIFVKKTGEGDIYSLIELALDHLTQALYGSSYASWGDYWSNREKTSLARIVYRIPGEWPDLSIIKALRPRILKRLYRNIEGGGYTIQGREAFEKDLEKAAMPYQIL